MSAEELLEELRASAGAGLLASEGSGLDAVVLLRPEAVRKALEFLKARGFNMLVDLTAADYSRFGVPSGSANAPHPQALGSRPEGSRFKLTYRLMKMDAGRGLTEARIALQCWAEGERGPASIRDLWPNADWLEREVWDMFGVSFADRPGIRRLLMYEEFVGHPLRKDYPIDKRQPLIGPKEDSARDRMTQGDLRPKIT